MDTKPLRIKKEDDDISELLAADIPDFREQEAVYQVNIYGYNGAGYPTDYHRLLEAYYNPDKAVSYAKAIDFEKLLTLAYPADVELVELCVEAVVNTDDYENYEEPIGSIFKISGKISRK